MTNAEEELRNILWTKRKLEQVEQEFRTQMEAARDYIKQRAGVNCPLSYSEIVCVLGKMWMEEETNPPAICECPGCSNCEGGGSCSRDATYKARKPGDDYICQVCSSCWDEWHRKRCS